MKKHTLQILQDKLQVAHQQIRELKTLCSNANEVIKAQKELTNKQREYIAQLQRHILDNSKKRNWLKKLQDFTQRCIKWRPTPRRKYSPRCQK